MKKSPKSFLLITDKNGDAHETIPKISSMDDIRAIVNQHINKNPSLSPYSVWLWNGSVWFPFYI